MPLLLVCLLKATPDQRLLDYNGHLLCGPMSLLANVIALMEHKGIIVNPLIIEDGEGCMLHERQIKDALRDNGII